MGDRNSHETYLYKDTLEVGVHGDGAELDEKVVDLEARPLGLHARLLLARVDRGELLHQIHEQRVGDERHLLLSGLEDAEHGGGLLRVVEEVYRPRWTCNKERSSDPSAWALARRRVRVDPLYIRTPRADDSNPTFLG